MSEENRKGQPERLSKLQKFILTATYKKTYLKKPLPQILPDLERLLSGYHEGCNEAYTDLYFRALYESDILLNYYNLTNWNKEQYGYEGGANKEKTAIKRSLDTLLKRGYINPYNQRMIKGRATGIKYSWGEDVIATYFSKNIITLTEKGRLKAQQLLFS